MAHHPAVATGNRWLRTFRPVARPSMRLVCLPHAGGAASFYRTWPELLPPWVELSALRYPGREDRLGEPFAESLTGLADQIAAALAGPGSGPGYSTAAPPVALFGHSMGAVLAYEVAARLRDSHGVTPAVLFVSGREAPHRAKSRGLSGQSDETLVAEVTRLGDPNPGALADPQLRELVLPALRNDYRLVDTYRFGSLHRLDVPVVAYTGVCDPVCSIAGVNAWAEVTTAGFAMRAFAGNHFFLVPHRAELLADVGRRLAAVLATGR